MKILTGKVIHGENIGEKQGYPTANLSPRVLINKKLDKGVYISKTTVGNKKCPSLLIIGVPGVKIQKEGKVEVYILNSRDRIYSRKIKVEIVKKLRPLVFYKNRRRLLAQIKKDEKTTKQYFKKQG